MKYALGAQAIRTVARTTPQCLPNGQTLDLHLMEIINDFGGAITFNRGAKLEILHHTKRKKFVIDLIYGTNSDDSNVYYKAEMYEHQLPPEFYAFGEASGGDQFCLNSKSGNVFYWFHDSIDEGDAMVCLDCNLMQFINKLSPDDDSEAIAKAARTAKVWLDF